ncbi:MAG: hypothetical protein JWO83_4516 [Caulobacteraceae bacterium]|nr:hypothetical protein [Caulobacteraceae bacterium]
MAATRIPPPPFNTPFLDGGFVSNAWQFFLSALYGALYGEGFDKVDAAHAAAMAAVPRATQVVAGGGLQAGGSLGGNVAVTLYRLKCVVAALPTSGNGEGDWAYAVDGRKPGEGAGSGTGVPCFWSNGHWIAATSGATVTA